MQEKEVILQYSGHLSFEKIGFLLNSLKTEIEARNIPLAYYKKILSVMIESLENIFKYNEFFEKEESLFPKFYPRFSLEKDDNFFWLSTGNPVQNKDVEKLRNRIDRINILDRDGLKELFRETLSDGQFTQKGGAGLGFIEMAKVSGEKIKYEIENINDKFSYYICQIPIPIKATKN